MDIVGIVGIMGIVGHRWTSLDNVGIIGRMGIADIVAVAIMMSNRAGLLWKFDIV